MKIKLNEEYTTEVFEFTEELVLETKSVACCQVDCMNINIHCTNCSFYPKLKIELEKVLIEE